MGESKYDPKSKGLPVSWRGMQRRLPKTLGTFQIVILAGFLSLLILRSSIGIASMKFASQYTTAADDENAMEEQSRVHDEKTVIDGEPKRNLVQTADFDAVEKQFEDDMDEQIAEHHLAEVRAATGKDVKNVKEVKKPRKAGEVVGKKKPGVTNPKEEIAENFEQVEAQMAEEETADELAGFEKFRRGQEDEKVGSSKPRTKPAESKKVTEKETADEKGAKKIEQTVNANAGKVKDALKVEYIEPEPIKLTPVELKALTKEAMANMSKLTRRDHPDAITLGPKISDWDEQRAAWLEKNPDMKTTDPHKPKVLLLSGSQPMPCDSPVGDHYLLKMIKNKVDYARIHKLEIFYNFAHLDRPLSHFWAKLPLIRKMMLMRPEVEWIFWMDSDALFTDMVFEIPFERYQEHNLVMWGYPEGVYGERSWVACNTGVMFLRNNQWTLDLLEIWSHFGPQGEIRNESGKVLSSYLSRRPSDMMADDQSALVYLLLTMPELRPKIGLEDEYLLSGYWVPLVGRYEEFSEKSRPGAGGRDWPFTTHFTGCQPCSGLNNEQYGENSCVNGMERAFNFADNQVLRPFGFEHENLHGSKVLRIRNETTKPIRSVPVDNPWAVQSFYS